MLARNDIERLIPHKGSMCLLDRIVAWDANRLEAAASSHIRLDNPLRSAAGLHTVTLCEYGAQAMAVHGALAANLDSTRGQPRQGVLASLRQVQWRREFVDGLQGELLVNVERLHALGDSAQYQFNVRHADLLIIEGRATIKLQPV